MLHIDGGEGGIRTPDRLAPMSDFESGAFNRALPPLRTSILHHVYGLGLSDSLHWICTVDQDCAFLRCASMISVLADFAWTYRIVVQLRVPKRLLGLNYIAQLPP
jgi:hypothetical protein